MVTVIIPTKDRPNELYRCVKSIPANYGICIYATKPSDIHKEIYLTSHKELHIEFGNKTVVEAFNYMASISKGNILPTSDDTEFMPTSIFSVNLMMNTYKNDAVIGLVVDNMKCNDDAFVLVGSKFLKERGYLFDKGFEHFYADTELGDYAKRLSKFYICNNARIKNYHPNVTGVEDRTHKHRRSEKLIKDKKHYESLASRSLLHA